MLDFPLLNYFMYTKYDIDFFNALKQEKDYMSRYPLLYNYLNYSHPNRNLFRNYKKHYYHLIENYLYLNVLLQ